MTRRAVVPGLMVTLVMVTKSLGSAISVEHFVLQVKGKRSRKRLRVAGSGGMREAQCRRTLERALGLLLFSRWWVGLGSKAAHVRPSAHTLEAFGNEAGRGTAVALAEALVPRCHVCT